MPDGRLGNSYDINVWNAEKILKQRKEELTDARRAASKKGKEPKDKKAGASKKSSSSSSGGSIAGGLLSAGANLIMSGVEKLNEEAERDEEIVAAVDKYEEELERKYPIDNASEEDMKQWLRELEAESKRLDRVSEKYFDRDQEDDIRCDIAIDCQDLVDELFEKMLKKYKGVCVERYSNTLTSKFPVDSASDSDLAAWLPKLLFEIEHQEELCIKNKKSKINHPIYSEYKSLVCKHANQVCNKLKEKNSTLYSTPEVQEVVKKIKPGSATFDSKKVLKIIFAPIYIVFKIYSKLFEVVKSLFGGK